MDGRFPTRPKGATQMVQYGVAALEKDPAILCGLRLVLDHLGGSESVNITLKEYRPMMPGILPEKPLMRR